MRATEFRSWLSRLDQLNQAQREQLQAQLSSHPDVLSEALAAPERCPHCQAKALRPWGTSHGLARYRCRGCGRTCNALTGTPMARLRHRECWGRYAQALVQSLTVRDAAAFCGVHKNTAFRWRHRFLRLIAEHRAQHESGIVEADETFFLESFKGQRQLPRLARKRGGTAQRKGFTAEQIPVLVVRDRSGRHADFHLEKLNAVHVGAVLRPLLDPDAVLCTDSAAVYHSVTKAAGITHRRLNLRQKRRTDGAFHIQNVNAYDSRLKAWMIPFHGVATKYLANYLGWRRLLERYGNDINPLMCMRESLGYYPLQQLTQT
ncbi:IS1595 family transposase [Pseudomonas sp. GCM10022188]|uniref:IS1595 family transposase n=1 Tax=Pseudomonas TaxID=286 RepID=UPI001E3679CB|nr:IS1595 family transposase [Pseudomonas oryzagri]MCC6076719.1 IS1595 family transposase [Pseudomonas oryzagri]